MKQSLMNGIFMPMIAFLLFFMSCGHKHVYTITTGNTQSVTINNNAKSINPTTEITPKVTGISPRNIPSATAFRMSGDYTDNVGITIGKNGELTYFPDPKDITADSAPISLGNGWWLNRQGIGPNSVFLKYTFAEYAALPAVPSPNQLKIDVLPGAKVTEFIELPMNINEANDNIEAVKAYIKSL